jgi:hypothetical protein
MADIINLRRARKVRDRVAKAVAADENRARFGRTTAQKVQDQAEARSVARTLDGAALNAAKREVGPTPESEVDTRSSSNHKSHPNSEKH